MGMQTDVMANSLAASGSVFGGRARVRGALVEPGASAGSVVFKDGGSGGTELILFTTPANTTGTGSMYIIIPNDGVRFEADPYLTLTNVTSVTFFYG